MSGDNLWSYMDRDGDAAGLNRSVHGPDELYLGSSDGVYLTETAVAGLASVLSDWLADKQKERREKERQEKERQEMDSYRASQQVRDMHTQSVDDDERWAQVSRDMAAMREQLTQIDQHVARLEGAADVRDRVYAEAAYRSPERIDLECRCEHQYSDHGTTGKCNVVRHDTDLFNAPSLCPCGRFRLSSLPADES